MIVHHTASRPPDQQTADERVRTAASELLATYGIDTGVAGDAVLIVAQPVTLTDGTSGIDLHRIALGETPHARALGLLSVAGSPMELNHERWLGL